MLFGLVWGLYPQPLPRRRDITAVKIPVRSLHLFRNSIKAFTAISFLWAAQWVENMFWSYSKYFKILSFDQLLMGKCLLVVKTPSMLPHFVTSNSLKVVFQYHCCLCSILFFLPFPAVFAVLKQLHYPNNLESSYFFYLKLSFSGKIRGLKYVPNRPYIIFYPFSHFVETHFPPWSLIRLSPSVGWHQ